MREDIDRVCAAIGATIRTRRKLFGLRLHHIARQTGISLGYISQIELGRNSASLDALVKIAAALDLTIGQLFASVQWPESEYPITGE